MFRFFYKNIFNNAITFTPLSVTFRLGLSRTRFNYFIYLDMHNFTPYEEQKEKNNLVFGGITKFKNEKKVKYNDKLRIINTITSLQIFN